VEKTWHSRNSAALETLSRLLTHNFTDKKRIDCHKKKSQMGFTKSQVSRNFERLSFIIAWFAPNQLIDS